MKRAVRPSGFQPKKTEKNRASIKRDYIEIGEVGATEKFADFKAILQNAHAEFPREKKVKLSNPSSSNIGYLEGGAGKVDQHVNSDHSLWANVNCATYNIMALAYSLYDQAIYIGSDKKFHLEKNNPFYFNETPDDYVKRCVRTVQSIMPLIKAGKPMHLQEASGFFIKLLVCAMTLEGIKGTIAHGNNNFSKGSVATINDIWADQKTVKYAEHHKDMQSAYVATIMPLTKMSKLARIPAELLEQLENSFLGLMNAAFAGAERKIRRLRQRMVTTIINSKLHINIHMPVGWINKKSVSQQQVQDKMNAVRQRLLEYCLQLNLPINEIIMAGDFNVNINSQPTTYGGAAYDTVLADDSRGAIQLPTQINITDVKFNYLHEKKAPHPKTPNMKGSEIRFRMTQAIKEYDRKHPGHLNQPLFEMTTPEVRQSHQLWVEICSLFTDAPQSDATKHLQQQLLLVLEGPVVEAPIMLANKFKLQLAALPEIQPSLVKNDQRLKVDASHAMSKAFTLSSKVADIKGRFVQTFGRWTVLLDSVKPIMAPSLSLSHLKSTAWQQLKPGPKNSPSDMNGLPNGLTHSQVL